MKSKPGKTDYSMTFYNIESEKKRYTRVLFLPFVKDTTYACKWILEKIVRRGGKSVTHYRIYHRKTREILGVYKFEDTNALNPITKGIPPSLLKD